MKVVEKSSRPKTKRRRTIGLQLTSPYKRLDRVFRPFYVLVVQRQNESRRQVITAINIYTPKFQKKSVDNLQPQNDVTTRRFYKNIVEKTNYQMQAKIHVGTVEGDFGCVEWDGYEFATDLAVNIETCRWSWSSKMHDGPITEISRSNYFSNTLATVGGKMFAIWKDDLYVPVMVKRCNIGYTVCCWGVFRPTILILGRMDGSVELWDFIVKSHEPTVIQSLSGRLLTGIYPHELDLDPPCVAFCDFNGILRLFLVPTNFVMCSETQIKWMSNFNDRQSERIRRCRRWQDLWATANAKDIELMQAAAKEAEKEQLERKKSATVLLAQDTPAVEVTKAAKPWELIEEARERWKAMELKRMQQVILEKKGLSKEDLERQREPILKMRQAIRRKKQRLRDALDAQDEIFDHTTGMFFPDRHQETKRMSLTPAVRVVRKKFTVEAPLEDSILQKEVEDMDRTHPDDDIMYNFMETQAEVLRYLQMNPFKHKFDWKKILGEGKSRRISMDYQLTQSRKSNLMYSRHSMGSRRKSSNVRRI